jgi:tetratricopeptide (TPR) repeat protein
VGLLELVTREHMTGVKYRPEDNERTYTQRLVELAPDSAAAHCGKAILAFFDWDFPAAERHIRRSILIHPDYEFARQMYGFMLDRWARPVEARQQLETARRLNPSKVQIHRALAHSYYVERNFARAIEMYRTAINWQPPDVPCHLFLGCAYRAMGEYEKAIDIFEAMESLQSGRTAQVAARFDRLRLAFKENGARGYWQEEWNQAPTNGFYERASFLVHLGDTDGAFNLLNQANQVHERLGPVQDWLTCLVFDVDWDPLRRDPRFQELLDKIGFTKVNPKLKQ